MPRRDVHFTSGSDRCAAWLWPPPGGVGAGPCVVLGHGFSATREARLDAYGERFAAAGYAVLAFDYRHFGASTGDPRELLDIPMQLADWRAAVAFARELDGVDPDRIALWGTSFAGGHVLETAADDPRIAAVVSQVPHVDGRATMGAMKPWIAAGAVAVGWADRAGARLGRAPIYLPRKGWPGLDALYPDHHEPRTWVAARVFTEVPRYSPGRRAGEIACPLLVQVAERDTITPPGAALAAAERAPRGQSRSYPVSHLEIYAGQWFERAVADQLSFVAESLHV